MSRFKKYGLKVLVALIIVLTLFIMVYAAGYQEVFMDTVLETGEVKIDLNNGEAIFDGNALNIEPNKTVVSSFTVANIGTADCYYKVYLENIEGELAEFIVFDIYDESGTLVMRVNLAEFNSDNPLDLQTILVPGEEVEFTIQAYFNSAYGNEYQDIGVTFDVAAEATQSKNN